MGEEIRITREVFEALVSETRIAILKKLDERAMTVSELARELEVGKSAVHEHLARLAEAGLVEKRASGRKWVYYHLTPKARGILHPERRTRILVLLSSALLALLGGVFSGWRYMRTAAGVREKAAPAAIGVSPEEALLTGAAEPYLALAVLLFTSCLLLMLLAYREWRQKPL